MPALLQAGRSAARGATAALCLLTVAATSVTAQGSDFLFEPPRVTLGFHGGFYRAGANSGVFDFTERNLTVESRDFDSPAFGGQIALRVTDRIDVAFDATWTRSEVASESRDFVGADDLPIAQTTTFSQTPISANVKFYLAERGRSIGNLAWIPTRLSAYVGAGVGFANYTFSQTGDFVTCEIDGVPVAVTDCLQDGELVDGATLPIVFDRLESSSTGALGQVLAGAEFAVTPRVIVVFDGRYRWAAAPMRDAWAEFEDIDLSGLSLSLGLGLRL